jgi:hypothetical protein
VETYIHAGSGRWKNRIVDGPDLPNAYLHRADAEREGRGLAEFLNCDFRVEPGAADESPPAGHGPSGPDPHGPAPEVLARAVNGHIQALAARLERLESGEPDDGEDVLRAELSAQVAARLAEAAHQYAGLAHEIAAGIHHTEADDLDRAGEIERAALQRKAASVAEELAAAQREAHEQAPRSVE